MLDSTSTILELLRSGDATAREVTEQTLRAIGAIQPTINAYTHVAYEAALNAADAVDQDRKAGRPLPPLAGLPVAIKDVLCTSDMPTTCSSNMLRNFTPPYDATVVAKLKRAGAIVVGKTNMDEFAMGASTETSAMGLTRNPWDEQRTPGGSSGGAAAAVAAGTVPLSIGTDTGGSIRQPAAFCGITGLKPTYGRCSRLGLVAFASSLDQAGPMGWSVDDVAIGLQAMAGYDPADSTSVDHEVPDYQAAIAGRDMKGVRIGVLRDSIDQDGVAPAIRTAVAEAEKVFTDLGAEIVEVSLQHSPYWVPTYYVIAPCEASSNLSRFDGAHYGYRHAAASTEDSIAPMLAKTQPLEAMYRASRANGFGSEVKRRIMVGTYALSEGYYDAYYNQALKVRRLISRDYETAFEDVDVLLGPVTPSPAFGLGENIDDPIAMYLCDLFTVGANLAGVPAISLPAGLDDDGLPVAIQLQAPVMQEARLLAAGAGFQSATTYHRMRPNDFVAS
ncbi:Asp-tRNA(Asn)/Glu-tRNA(Gln) amidotransferase subunit GatA [Allorhodopirellula heiligendammensis]|uniref:Glutamyl-tRNA(Gln) amidotransferase subunit A n=1 Tax=Allorhodopirellula heiligendammensis TaxID=2714739 RepID=A0A5C6BY56_9BACT|nr:Asp-tRNA(Asn)/Glu-tRNA(Gln) amidotransferase subunit GatA [Allorhodopirellula heiligendammensis]TWU16587.1 Glutamyl-tRNA(Gln) amidotransferase subunit A [Allorhodopirellula heiligendammensis]